MYPVEETLLTKRYRRKKGKILGGGRGGVGYSRGGTASEFFDVSQAGASVIGTVWAPWAKALG